MNNNLFILLNFKFNMFSGAKIIKKYGINSNNPAILYEMVGLLYEPIREYDCAILSYSINCLL